MSSLAHSSYAEVLREPAFAGMVRRGLEDSDGNRALGDEEMKRRIKAWRK